MIVPESVINLNFTLIDESLNLVTLTITWKVSLYIITNNYTFYTAKTK